MLADRETAAALAERQAPAQVSTLSVALALAALRTPPDVSAVAVAERLRVAMAESPFALSGDQAEVPVTISVGVATMCDDNDTPALLL